MSPIRALKAVSNRPAVSLASSCGSRTACWAMFLHSRLTRWWVENSTSILLHDRWLVHDDFAIQRSLTRAHPIKGQISGGLR